MDDTYITSVVDKYIRNTKRENKLEKKVRKSVLISTIFGIYPPFNIPLLIKIYFDYEIDLAILGRKINKKW